MRWRQIIISPPDKTPGCNSCKTHKYEELWAELPGGFAQGGGELMSPDSTRTPTDTLQWPLPVARTITSQFGHRVDPITGEISSHTSTDIACAEGTLILAAADGTVTVDNVLDS